jgi:hypothetical protein
MRGYMELSGRDKSWDITVAQLSHTPMSKEGGSAQSRSVAEIRRQIDDPVRKFDMRRERGIRVAREKITREPGNSVVQ